MNNETPPAPDTIVRAEMPVELEAWLDLADQDLANRNTPIADRTLLSIQRLLDWEALMDEDGVPFSMDPHELVDSDWFIPLAKMVGAWYRKRYGESAKVSSNDALRAFVLIRTTPFSINIPRHQVESGDESGTAWMHLSDKVREGEKVLSWIAKPPDLTTLKSDALA
jgi:hypothetical protein